MTTVEVIDITREKLNKNSINDNIAFDNPRIIEAVNEAAIKYLEWSIEKKNEDDTRYIQKLIVNNKPLVKSSIKSKDSDFFELPKDYFDFINISAKAEKDKCKVNINLWEIKGQNVGELLADEYNKPSYYYRESFYSIASDKIRIYKDEELVFSNCNLTYYRYPIKIDIEGYQNIKGRQSSTINPELDDKAMYKIIDIAVKNLNVNVENLNRFQVDNQKIISKF